MAALSDFQPLQRRPTGPIVRARDVAKAAARRRTTGRHRILWDRSWWGQQHPFTGRVAVDGEGLVIAREMTCGWWRREACGDRCTAYGPGMREALQASQFTGSA